ncbi:Asp-tRNA(Asn)/Glu-tRNA(Gln) amidotransferase subunit GatC [bacterium]|nr:Asp-tRNA(Asn)/Glu-tRNA(Gln) amidotransferase subunit GatC [bacterium]MBU1918443.1 Asp-tRNA(Asn)/Glu-tRNA(Gln) amidotransferase subunit GatC [bacterium]
MINKNEIIRISKLANIKINDTDIPKLSQELNQILEYVEKINELDLKDIKPTSHAVATHNVFREDLVVQNEIINDVLNTAPDTEENFFKVPKVI